MQAHFLCLAHNLIQLCERPLAAEYEIRNVEEEKRRAHRLAEQPCLANARKAVPPARVQTYQRLTQTSLKLFRWVRGCPFFRQLSLDALVPGLTRS
jgi:hypothetical protein